MAIYSCVPPPEQQTHTQAAIEAWTASLPISPMAGGAATVHHNSAELAGTGKVSKKEGLRRDSFKRREALLRGKEGSRRRQRWENDQLLHVPNAQPPLPSDWTVQPTHPVHHDFPCYLAPLWDTWMRPRCEEKQSSNRKGRVSSTTSTTSGRVPAELRRRMKKSKGAKSLLQGLEEEIRGFLAEWISAGSGGRDGTSGKGKKEIEEEVVEVDSEDEEIVFVGRNGGMNADKALVVVEEEIEQQLEREKRVWDGLVEDGYGGFGRWLVHSIADYYGLASRSITIGDPARREAYVGIRNDARPISPVDFQMPRPLWGIV